MLPFRSTNPALTEDRMLISERLIRIAPIIAVATLALALAGYFLTGAGFALNRDAMSVDASSLRHEDNARYVVAQPTSNAPPATAPADAVPIHIIEQYKIYVTDLGNAAAQLGTTQSFYLTIVSALVAVLAFKETIRPIQDYFAPVSIVIFIFIVLVSVTWLFTAQQFENLIAAKFEVLRALEKRYPGLYPMFSEQTQHYEAHWAYGIIRHQSVLIILVGLGALFITAAGIGWQIRNRKALKSMDAAGASTLLTVTEEIIERD
jgi:hypothetical protein